MEDLEERAKRAGIQIAVRTNFINKPANAVANLKVCALKRICLKHVVSHIFRGRGEGIF